MINLTKEERDRFAHWLLQEVETNKGLIEQMKKLKVPTVKHFEARNIAFKSVANYLNSIESEEI